MGGGLATAGRGLGGRGQLGTGGLGHHIEGMLQGVAKYRKTTSYQLVHVQINDSMILIKLRLCIDQYSFNACQLSEMIKLVNQTDKTVQYKLYLKLHFFNFKEPLKT